MTEPIDNYYGSKDLCNRIFDALEKSGKDINNLALKDLSTIDQLHTGGHKATLSLARDAELPAGSKVLDAGCGIGGSTRLLALEMGLSVLGMDLVDVFIDTARALSRATGTLDNTRYMKSDVTETGLETGSLDAVWCQHTLMNIPDKTAAFKEFHRILKTGGRLVLHEICRGEKIPLILPVPWADKSELSHLLPIQEMHDLLVEVGFTPVRTRDLTDEQARPWWQRVRAVFEGKTTPPSPLGPHIIFGGNGLQFGTTMSANLEEDRIRLWESVWEVPD